MREGAVDLDRAHQRQPGDRVGDGLRVDRQQALGADGDVDAGADRLGRGSLRADHGHLVDAEHGRRAQGRVAAEHSDADGGDGDEGEAKTGTKRSGHGSGFAADRSDPAAGARRQAGI